MPKLSDKHIMMSVRIDGNLNRKIEKYAKDNQKSKSDVVRSFLAAGVSGDRSKIFTDIDVR